MVEWAARLYAIALGCEQPAFCAEAAVSRGARNAAARKLKAPDVKRIEGLRQLVASLFWTHSAWSHERIGLAMGLRTTTARKLVMVGWSDISAMGLTMEMDSAIRAAVEAVLAEIEAAARPVPSKAKNSRAARPKVNANGTAVKHPRTDAKRGAYARRAKRES